MQLKCSRYIFTYTSAPDLVEDYILRSDDLAVQTYGRDKHFSRLNQVLEQARFLGWPLPRFGNSLPEDLLEIPSAGVNHIFENQAKLLIDVAPATHVQLENGKYCPLKMVAGTTAAGDLVWRCHLLLDGEGNPYIQRNGKKYRVKLKGTKVVCQAENLPYDEGYIFECFGGDEGIFPVPFLPEFFSDHPIAQKFSPEEGVIEVVYIHEEVPVKVLANDVVPWYRPLEINYTKALPLVDENLEGVTQLIDGWDELKDNQQVDLKKKKAKPFIPSHQNYDDQFEEEVTPTLETSSPLDDETFDSDIDSGDEVVPVEITNISVGFSEIESKKFNEYEKTLSKLNIASKEEADSLRQDPAQKDRAEKWLVNAVNRYSIIANASSKIGAVIDLIGKHPNQPILVIQSRKKWAAKLSQVLNERGIKSDVFSEENEELQLSKFEDGQLNVLVTHSVVEDLFIEGLVIISVSSVDSNSWLSLVDDSNTVYTLCIKDLGFNDPNYISNSDEFEVSTQEYAGSTYDILKLSLEDNQTKAEAPETAAEIASPTITSTEKPSEEKPKEPKEKKPKFKIKLVGQNQGRPKTASSYEKAVEYAKKQETEGKKCEIYGPDSLEAMYITGIGELK